MPKTVELRSAGRDATTPEWAPKSLYAQRLAVAFEYPVVFESNILDPDNRALAWCVARREPERRHRCFVVVDQGFVAAWPSFASRLRSYVERHRERIELVGDLHVLAGGEAAKNDPSEITRLRDAFGRARLDRHSTVLVFGGGAVLDAAGFAAATTHRGLRLVRAPTTVLAQNDAGVGVKNAINGRGTKNYIGTFAPPFAVINDVNWLTSLGEREHRAGIAEAVKVGLVRDPRFFEWLESQAEQLRAADAPTTATMIRRCAELHLDHIRQGGDPFELGNSRPLDFGHWAAHKLEDLTRHALLHGEAVAIGIALDTCYAALTGLASETTLARVIDLLGALGLPVWHPALRLESRGRPTVLEGLEEFREHLGGELAITMLRDVGDTVELRQIDLDRMSAAIARLSASSPPERTAFVG